MKMKLLNRLFVLVFLLGVGFACTDLEEELTADFSEGSTTYTELNNSLRLMQSALHELRPLLKQVKDKPNSLIFNDGVQEEIEPKAYQQEKED